MHLSAGKQMHPLFTSRKEVKMLREVQDTKKLEDRQLPWYTWGEVISYAPVHILGTQVHSYVGFYFLTFCKGYQHIMFLYMTVSVVYLALFSVLG